VITYFILYSITQQNSFGKGH